jgi:hypothetical protein
MKEKDFRLLLVRMILKGVKRDNIQRAIRLFTIRWKTECTHVWSLADSVPVAVMASRGSFSGLSRPWGTDLAELGRATLRTLL